MDSKELKHVRKKLQREFGTPVLAPLTPTMLALLAQLKEAEKEWERATNRREVGNSTKSDSTGSPR